MTRSSDKGQANTSRKFLGLAIFIVVAIAGYSAVWFYLADQLESRSKFLLSDLSDSDVTADCQDLNVRGYPFRLGLFCTSVTAGDKASKGNVTAGSFRSAAQIYQPNHIVSELDGPATFGLGKDLLAKIDWENLRSSTVFGLSGLARASLESRQLRATLTPPASQNTMQLSAGSTQFHARQNDANLDAAFNLDAAELTIDNSSIQIPTFDMAADLTLADRASLMSGHSPHGQQPWRDLSASLNSFSADLGQGAILNIAGPFSIDAAGYLTGKFSLEIRGRDAWQKLLGKTFPERAGDIANVINILAAIGQKQDALKLPVNVDRGAVRVGFIQIGAIPPF